VSADFIVDYNGNIMRFIINRGEFLALVNARNFPEGTDIGVT